MLVGLEDAALLILLVAMVPVTILIVGTPVALAIRVILALADRL